MKFKVVTSLSKHLWDKYAKECISTWLTNLDLPEGSELEIWVQGVFPSNLPTVGESGLNLRWKSLDTQSEGWKDFVHHYSNHPVPQVEPGHQYRFNFMPFSCKVFALAEAAWSAKDSEFTHLLWLDADTKFTRKVDAGWLQVLLKNANLAYLDRGEPWGYGETGFILSKVEEPITELFIEQAKIYGSGQLFFFREWHDAFIFTSIVRRAAATDDRVNPVNLNQDMNSQYEGGRYPFVTSPLNERIIHLKGPLKENA